MKNSQTKPDVIDSECGDSIADKIRFREEHGRWPSNKYFGYKDKPSDSEPTTYSCVSIPNLQSLGGTGYEVISPPSPTLQKIDAPNIETMPDLTRRESRHSLRKIAYYTVSAATVGLPQSFRIARNMQRIRSKGYKDIATRMDVIVSTAFTVVHVFSVAYAYGLLIEYPVK